MFEFVLGSGQPFESIVEQAEYDLGHLEIIFDDGSEKTLTRALKRGDIRIIDGLFQGRPDQKQGVSVSARHGANISLSKILLAQLGAADKRVQTNTSGATRGMSDRDLERSRW